jgi:Carboxysome Shell Carbonic Anhydrase
MDKTKVKIQQTISDFFPNFPKQVVQDFSHLIYGNATVVANKLRKNGAKPEVVNHKEQVVCLGSGFDWLHLPNFALIVNPVALDPHGPFVTQLKVIQSNIKENRIPAEDGVIIMISVSYRELKDKMHSILKAISLLDFAQEIVEKQFQDLLDVGLQIIVGTTDDNTRLFELINEDRLKKFSKSNYQIPTNLNKIGSFVLSHNKSQSEEFTSPYNITQRRVYRENFPTEIMVLKCMDGRIHLPIATDTPMGILQPQRNVGAKFHFGWKAFYDKIVTWIDYAIKNKRSCLLLVTYHFSRVDKHLGCAGHGYDTEAAKVNAEELVEQAEFALGKGKNSEISVAMIGYCTDTDSIIVHGANGEILDIEDFVRKHLITT